MQPFSEQYVRPAKNAQEVIKTCSEQLYYLYQSLFAAKPREFRLTKEQSDRLGLHLKTAYPMLIRLLGEDFHSVILRMAIQIERIAMILTALRTYSLPFMGEELRSIGHPVDGRRTLSGVGFYCSDLDYQTAELIGNKLLLHMAQAYQLIKGTEKVEQPQVKPLDQKQILLSLLPDEFESKTLVAEAQLQGIPQSTVMRWCSQWIDHGILLRLSYGHYKKIA